MTNQERLQENNNLIKEIRQLLDNKMLVAAGGTKIVDIELPEKFATASSIYTYKVNRNTVLFGSNANSSGLYVYHKKDDTLKVLHDGGHNWSSFYSITDNLILVATNSGPNPLLVYDIEKDEAISVGIYYNGSLNVKQIDDNRFFISTTSSISKGLAIFDARTKKAKTIHSTSYNYTYFAQMGDYWFIATNTGSDGILKFNSVTEEITMVHGNGRWAFLNVVDDKCYFSSDTSSQLGLYVYDNTTNTVTTITENGYYWSYVFKIGDKIYASNMQSSTTGLYEITNNTLNKIYDDGGYGYRFAPVINDRAIITGSQRYALIYNLTDGSMTKIAHSNLCMLGNSIVLGNKMLLTPVGTTTSCPVVYNYETNEMKVLSRSGMSDYSVFKPDGDNCYMLTNALNKPVMYYTNADDSIKIVGYRMEV